MAGMIPVVIQPDVCVRCGAEFKRGVQLTGSVAPRPKSGDIAACIRCGAIAKFGDDLRLRGFTDIEVDRLLLDPETMTAIGAMVRGIYFLKHARG